MKQEPVGPIIGFYLQGLPNSFLESLLRMDHCKKKNFTRPRPNSTNGSHINYSIF